MGLLTNLFEKRSLANPPEWLVRIMGAGPSASGVNVTEESAMKTSAVFACVRILAETVASLPLVVYERKQPRGKERAGNHALYRLLHDQPNDYMTSMQWREVSMAHLGLWGNAYSEIERNGAGRVMALWPLPPNKVKPEIVDGNRKVYRVEAGSQQLTLRDDQMLHIPGLGLNGLTGLSPISMAREAIGLSQAAEEFGARFFANDARPNVLLSHPGKLSEDAAKRLRTSWEKMHKGNHNSHRVGILEEGMALHEVGIPQKDAQFLETRKFQIQEIARIFRVPPHMLADLDRATFSNIEHQSIEFVVHTIRPWLIRWEQAINTKLFGDGNFAEFLVDGLLRGDTASRYQSYATARQWGWMSANDIRELENQNPIDGGDSYLVPMNMIPAEEVSGIRAVPEKRSEPELRSGLHRYRIAQRYQKVIRDAADRLVRREVEDVLEAARKHLRERSVSTWDRWLEDYYEQFPERIRREMNPALASLQTEIASAVAQETGEEPDADRMDEFRSEYIESYSFRHTDSSRGQLSYLVEEGMAADEDLEEVVATRVGEWRDKRSGKIALNESTQFSNAVARVGMASVGITMLRWAAVGPETCPLCEEMDGRVVGIEEPFLGRDQELGAEGTSDLHVRKPISHPPLHSGCVCQIIPG